ncbi:MAG: hypothetical protein AMS21_02760, partial [Gemmatimonas sp. SG8_38_2]
MARVDVIMPQMGESIAEGTITKWLKGVGDEVERDESILEISTDKVDADIPSPVSGILAEIVAQESDTVEVGTVIARIETEAGDEVAAVVETAKAEAASAKTLAASSAAERAASSRASKVRSAPGDGDGDGARGAETREGRLRTRSTPLVRRIAAEHGIDIAGLSGSGVGGRVTKKDIMAFIDQRRAMPTLTPGVLHVPIHGETLEIRIPDVLIRDTDRIEEMDVMRQRIMEHMLMSRRVSAHVSTVFEIDFDHVAQLRKELKPRFEQDGVKLTYLPFIIKAVVEGLKAFPVLNASVVGRKIVYHNHYNIGIAVAMDEGAGLIVPVIKGADELSLLG